MNFKLADTGPVQLDTDQPEKLESILELCGERLGQPIGSVIVIRDGKVVRSTDLIEVNDTIDVYPAISGG